MKQFPISLKQTRRAVRVSSVSLIPSRRGSDVYVKKRYPVAGRIKCNIWFHFIYALTNYCEINIVNQDLHQNIGQSYFIFGQESLEDDPCQVGL